MTQVKALPHAGDSLPHVLTKTRRPKDNADDEDADQDYKYDHNIPHDPIVEVGEGSGSEEGYGQHQRDG